MAAVDRDVELWIKKFGDGVAKKSLEIARARCGSKTLRKSMYIVSLKQGIGGYYHSAIYVPQYWAKMYHDGTGPKVAKRSAMVVFRDHRKDPRIKNGYPMTKRDIKSFWEMPVAWRYWKKQYKEAIKRKQTPPFYFAKQLGPNPPHPFLPSDKKLKDLCAFHIKYDPETSIAKFVRSKMVMEGLKNRKKSITRNV